MVEGETFSDIKLVIWDLDETFWHGVLSENPVECIPQNSELIHLLTDAGIVNSICSKNDEQAVNKQLQTMDLDSYFVFRSVNWSAKGERVKQIIKKMNLRPVNVVFIDDNSTNRAEVLAANPGIRVYDVDYIERLSDYIRTITPKDKQHKRLAQYHVLEQKIRFQATAGSNEEFLSQSHIRVEIKDDCMKQIDRIVELIQRSNQLNFTKIRSTEPEIRDILKDSTYTCAYVEVRDDFGDYGIVGFYAMQGNRVEHFVFSCRTLNMGVEQYVWRQIGCPSIIPVGEVASSPETPDPYWINQSERTEKKAKQSIGQAKILMKGPCDISQLLAYLSDNPNIESEFSYVGRNGVQVEGCNHSTQLLESCRHSPEILSEIADTLPFGDDAMFATRLFEPGWQVVVYSLFLEGNLGMYRHKRHGVVVAFGEYLNDITREPARTDSINQTIWTANCHFTDENLRQFADEYEWLGRNTPEQVLNNVRSIREKLSPDTHLVLVLGSELEYTKQEVSISYEGRHEYCRQVNELIRNWASEHPHVHLLEFNKYTKTPDSFTDSPTHFSRIVYYQAAKDLSHILSSCGQQAKRRSPFSLIARALANRLRRITGWASAERS